MRPLKNTKIIKTTVLFIEVAKDICGVTRTRTKDKQTAWRSETMKEVQLKKKK